MSSGTGRAPRRGGGPRSGRAFASWTANAAISSTSRFPASWRCSGVAVGEVSFSRTSVAIRRIPEGQSRCFRRSLTCSRSPSSCFLERGTATASPWKAISLGAPGPLQETRALMRVRE